MELKITTENFQQEVLNSDLPVLVDFYADWCGPCKMMAPTISALADEYAGRFKIGKCDVEKNKELANTYRVMSIPMLVIFKNGEPVETMIGMLQKNQLADKLDNFL